jgi:hypothetical protein
MRGIFFRGDTRHPTEAPGKLFKRGFKKRDPTAAKPELYYFPSRQKAPDLVAESAVCVSRDFFASASFPVDDLQTDSWIYVLDLDTTNMFNKMQYQYEYVVSHAIDSNADALWPMFGQERAVDAVAPEEIVAAILVNRKFNGNHVFTGGMFRPREYRANSHSGGPRSTASLVAGQFQGMIGTGEDKWITMPMKSSGIVKTTLGPTPDDLKLPKKPS